MDLGSQFLVVMACAHLEALSDAALDSLDFGVIGFDADTVVRRYNATESQAAGLAAHRVSGTRSSR